MYIAYIYIRLYTKENKFVCVCVCAFLRVLVAEHTEAC